MCLGAAFYSNQKYVKAELAGRTLKSTSDLQENKDVLFSEAPTEDRAGSKDF